jgi:hypothetical protein
LKAAILSGGLSGVAYAIAAEIDNRISGMNLDDLALLGRPFVSEARDARRVGMGIHLFNSVAVASLFPIARRVLPGGPVVQGVTYTFIENTVLYPVAAFEQMHPGIKRGEIDRYFSLKAYLLSIPRHVVFGVVLGLTWDRFAGKSGDAS